MPNQNNNQASNSNDQTVTQKTDDQKPIVSFPIIEDVLPPMPSTNEELRDKNEELGQTTEIKQDAVDTTPATATTDSGSAAPSNDVVMPTVVGTVPPPAKKFAGGKVIATILGLFLLVGGVGAGVFLTGQNQDVREKAGGGLRHEKKCIDGNNNEAWCWTSSDPECGDDPGHPVNCDSDATDGWNCSPSACDGCGDVTEGCGSTGDYWGGPPKTKCSSLKAYTSSWVLMSDSDLTKLKTGDQVNFCVSGVASAGIFNKGRFMINGVLRPETTTKRPGSDDFCDLYTIPTINAGTTFNVIGQIHHKTLGWK